MSSLNSHREEDEFEQLSLDIQLEVSPSEQNWSGHCYESPLAQHSFGVSLNDLPPGEHPRDRLVDVGPSALSTAELLSIVVGTGQRTGKVSALALGQHLLQILGADGIDPLRRLRGITVEELTTVLGIGPAKAATLVAAIELGKRVFLPKPEKRVVIDNPGVAVEALSQDLMWQSQECFALILLDVKHRLLGTQVVTIGTATETLAHPREVFRAAIHRGATRIIVAHNHPSGSVEPSPEDIALTKQLLQAGLVVGIPVLDHLILGGGQYCSLRQTTNLWQENPQE